MTEKRGSNNTVWWVVGLALAFLLGMCLCAMFTAAAGLAFFGVKSSQTSYQYGPVAPPAVTVVPRPELPAVPTPPAVPQVPGPDYQLPRGALLLNVVPGSPADAAGWEPGDIILAVDGREVDADYDVRMALADREPGDMVAFTWWIRRTREVTVTRVQLGEDPGGTGSAYLGIEYRMQR